MGESDTAAQGINPWRLIPPETLISYGNGRNIESVGRDVVHRNDWSMLADEQTIAVCHMLENNVYVLCTT